MAEAVESARTALEGKRGAQKALSLHPFSDPYDIVPRVFGGALFFYTETIKKQGIFLEYEMGGSDLYIPRQLTYLERLDAIFAEVAKAASPDTRTNLYVTAFKNTLANYFSSELKSDPYLVATWENGLGEMVYQPQLFNGMRLYTAKSSRVLIQNPGSKNWYCPTDFVNTMADSASTSRHELERIMISEETVETFLEPHTFKSREKALSVSRKMQARLEKAEAKDLRKQTRSAQSFSVFNLRNQNSSSRIEV